MMERVTRKQQKQQVQYHCEDCIHEYDRHEMGYDGKPFLCRCPFHKYSRFLKSDYCSNFKKK